MKLHKAGYSFLIKAAIVYAVIIILLLLIPQPVIGYLLIGVVTTLFLLILNFFRFPNRKINISDNNILAPADGKIVVVEETFEPEHLKERCIQVSIFMNVLNVHINWFAVNGITTYFKYHPGRYMAAYLPKSSTENERTTIAIKTVAGKEIVMRQIAGAMAKRIVSYVKVGEKVSQDQHAGFIKFGSRVDLFLPPDTEIKVNLNDKVVGSQTVIGVLK